MSCQNQIENQVLSDVHASLLSTPVYLSHAELSESRFVFKLPKSLSLIREDEDVTPSTCTNTEPLHEAYKDVVALGAERRTVAYQYDEDGDLVVKRTTTAEHSTKDAITIVHKMATELNMVGQQVWLGALLLCDFMFHYSGLFEGCVILDLGAGVGLTSIVAGLMAQTVFCTDHGDEILKLASLNVERNSHLHANSSVLVRELDWKAEPFLNSESKAFSSVDQNCSPVPATDSSLLEPYRVTDAEVDTLCTCSIILAAEVIYDHELTDAFFRLLYKLLLLKKSSKTVYLTVEKRQVFTVADREVVSPAYEHFRENLEDLCGIDEGPVRFLCSQVDTSFPQYFEYQRTKELELWKIETVFPHR